MYRLPWEKTVHMSTGLCGSEPYIAPEQFLGKRKPTSLYKQEKPNILLLACFFYLLHLNSSTLNISFFRG